VVESLNESDDTYCDAASDNEDKLYRQWS